MREIKFRAWHHGGGDPRVRGEMKHSHPFQSIFWKAVEDEDISVEVMQFTGLKDKNGVEIYEGDIVKIWEEWWNSGGMGEFKNVVVNFEKGTFQNCYDARKTGVEIIGNIHQNSELLSAKE